MTAASLHIDVINANRYYSHMKNNIQQQYSSDKNPADSTTNPALRPNRTTSRQLLQGHPELIIEHENREYRLRLTHSGKLILTA